MTEPTATLCPRCAVPAPPTNKFCMACGSVMAQVAAPPAMHRAPLAPPPLSVAAFASGIDVVEPVTPGQPAEPVKRVLSWAIDIVIVLIVSTLIGSVSGAVGAIALFVGGPLYYVAAVGHFGTGTAGHRLVGLEVVDARSGDEIDLTRAAMRLAVAALTVVPWGVAALLSTIGMFRGGRLAWHDHASQAVVATRRPAASFAPPVSPPA